VWHAVTFVRRGIVPSGRTGIIAYNYPDGYSEVRQIFGNDSNAQRTIIADGDSGVYGAAFQ
jgi:hypothetical protein